MERDDWRDVAIIVIVLGTFFDAFIFPLLLIADVIALAIFVVVRARRED